MSGRKGFGQEQMKQENSEEPKPQDVQRELDRTRSVHDGLTNSSVDHHQSLAIAASILALLIVIRLLLASQLFAHAKESFPLVVSAVTAAIICAAAVCVAFLIQIYTIEHLEDAASRYNLKRILWLVTGIVLLFSTLSLIFQHWYAAAVSLGLGSLILGLALQSPLASFFAWIYILIRHPYGIGDRIKIGDSSGDVIEVGYLDTRLWEFGGDYLSSDHPSGRIIQFPNSSVFNTAVYNYSWPLFPYVWNEIKFQIAYQSDFEFVASTMQKVVQREIGEDMKMGVDKFRHLLAQTPVDELEVREHPSAFFRINDNTWVEAIVRYLVHPKQAGRIKTKLIKQLLVELRAHPDKVLFPKGDSR